jgi:hypothetical protein
MAWANYDLRVKRSQISVTDFASARFSPDIDNVAPANADFGRSKDILSQRAAHKRRTLAQRALIT